MFAHHSNRSMAVGAGAGPAVRKVAVGASMVRETMTCGEKKRKEKRKLFFHFVRKELLERGRGRLTVGRVTLRATTTLPLRRGATELQSLDGVKLPRAEDWADPDARACSGREAVKDGQQYLLAESQRLLWSASGRERACRGGRLPGRESPPAVVRVPRGPPGRFRKGSGRRRYPRPSSRIPSQGHGLAPW